MLAALVAAPPAFAAEERGYTVPFEIKLNIVYVEASLNGQEGHVFLLDTGSTLTIVTAEAAERAGWSATRGRINYAPPIDVGGAVVQNMRVLIGDPPGGQALRNHGLDYSGILGHSFLERFVTTLDFVRRQMTLVPVARAAPLAADGRQSWIVPFRTAARVIVVEGKVNGQGPQTFVVDSGASHTYLMPETARKLGIRGKRRTLGHEEVEIATVKSISAGDAEARDFMVLIGDARVFRPLRQLGVNYDGVLGADYLYRFVVTLDYRVNQLRLALD